MVSVRASVRTVHSLAGACGAVHCISAAKLSTPNTGSAHKPGKVQRPAAICSWRRPPSWSPVHVTSSPSTPGRPKGASPSGEAANHETPLACPLVLNASGAARSPVHVTLASRTKPCGA